MGITTATALVGVGLSAYSAIKANKDKKKASKEAKKYQRQEIVNPYKDIPLSTYGTDIMREDASRDVATITEAARSAGLRGIATAIPRIQAHSNKVNQQIGMDLEKQDLRRKYNEAQAEMRIMGIHEQRDNQNLAALSSQYNAADQNFKQGLWGVASGLSSAARGLKADKANGDTWFN